MAKVNALQAVTACKHILRQHSNSLGQRNIGHLLAVRESVSAQLCYIAQICNQDVRSKIGVLVPGLAVDHFYCGNGHILVDALVVHVAGEGVIADGNGLIQVNIAEVVTVIEGHIADLCVVAQSHSGQVCVAEEGVCADIGIIADGYGLELREEVVIEVGIILIGVLLYLKGPFLVHAEGVGADGNIVTNGDGLQLITVMEYSLAHGHAIGDIDGGDIRKGKGVPLNNSVLGEVG